MASREKVFIIDGYNVLRSGPAYSHLTGPDWTDDSFNSAREILLNDVSLFCGGEASATIVYDGTRNQFSDGHTERVGQVKIVFSKAGKDADQTVIELARSEREKNKNVTVISSDSSIQNSVMGCGVTRMSSRDFCREFDSLRSAIDQDEDLEPAIRPTIASTIPSDVLKKLESLRDS